MRSMLAGRAALGIIAFFATVREARAQSLWLEGRIGRSSAVQHTEFFGQAREYEPLRGIAGGIAARADFTWWLSLQAEALYTEKGGQSGPNYLLRINYVEIPVLIRLTPLRWRGVSAFVTRGYARASERG